MYPITSIAGCCARAVKGHVTAPLSKIIRSRRLMAGPRASKLLSLAHCKGWRTGSWERSVYVRFGSKADICSASTHVRFTPNSDIDCVFRRVCFGPIADITCESAVAPLEPLSASLTLRIGEIAVKREADILHQGINAKMKALGRLAALSHMVEGPVELRQIFNFDHQMKVAKFRLT